MKLATAMLDWLRDALVNALLGMMIGLYVADNLARGEPVERGFLVAFWVIVIGGLGGFMSYGLELAFHGARNLWRAVRS